MIVDAGWFDGPNQTLLSLGVFEPAPPTDAVTCPECGEVARVFGAVATCRLCSRRFLTDTFDRRRFRLSRNGLVEFFRKRLGLAQLSDHGQYVCFGARNRTVYLVFRENEVDRETLLGKRFPLVVYVSAEPKPDETGRLEVASIDEVFFLDENGRVGVNRGLVNSLNLPKRPTIKPTANAVPRLLLMARIGPAILDYARERVDDGDLCGVSLQDIYRALCERIEGLDPEEEKDRKKVERALDALCETENDRVKAPHVKALRDALKAGRQKDAVAAIEALDADIKTGEWDAPTPEALESYDAGVNVRGWHLDSAVDPNSPFDHRSSFYDMDMIDENSYAS